jgi:DNA-binding Lrp family transcriptional regulator
MAEAIDNPLVQIAKRIIARVRPENETDDIRRLLYSALLYIKRVEGHKLSLEERQYPAHKRLRFSSIPLSKEIAEGLRDRIRIIDEYRIQSAPRIHEMIQYGFEYTSNQILTKDEITILQALAQNPLMNTSQLSQRLNKSRHLITRALTQLEDQFSLRRAYMHNPFRIKLTPFSLVFRTQSHDQTKKIENWIRKNPPLFQTALAFDVTYRNGFIGFEIPTQQRAFRLLEHRVNQLERDYLEKVQFHRVIKRFSNIRFDHYDYNSGQWLIPAELEDISQFLKINQMNHGGLSHLTVVEQNGPNQFDRIDLLIIKAHMTPRMTIADLRIFLSQYGYSLSNNTIWMRLKRLQEEGAIFPVMNFSRGGFEDFISLNILCNPQTQEQLQLLASYFPFTYSYLTNRGIQIFLKRPTGWGDYISKLIHDLPTVFAIEDLMVIYQERNYGSGLRDPVYNRWNEKRQYWEFSEKDI